MEINNSTFTLKSIINMRLKPELKKTLGFDTIFESTIIIDSIQKEMYLCGVGLVGGIIQKNKTGTKSTDEMPELEDFFNKFFVSHLKNFKTIHKIEIKIVFVNTEKDKRNAKTAIYFINSDDKKMFQNFRTDF